MGRRLLDTSILISCWRQAARGELLNKSSEDARQWAKETELLYGSRVIATPVVVEFLAGVMASHELTLAEAFLAEFTVIDNGLIPREDWEGAKRVARWVQPGRISGGKRGRGGQVGARKRHLGDCLVRAIANRFRLEVVSLDKGFPWGK